MTQKKLKDSDKLEMAEALLEQIERQEKAPVAEPVRTKTPVFVPEVFEEPEEQEEQQPDLGDLDQFVQPAMTLHGVPVFRVTVPQAAVENIPGPISEHGLLLGRYMKNKHLIAARPNKKMNYVWDFPKLEHAKRFAKDWCVTGKTRGGGIGGF